MPTTAKPKSIKLAKLARPKSEVGVSAKSPKIAKSSTPAVYMEAVGRRKTAIARVRTSVGSKTAITVNGKPFEQYFGTPSLCAIVTAPLSREGFSGKYIISAHVNGGGIHSQAEAVRHGLSRILVKEDATQKSELKKMGFLKRDSRKKERKHFGLKKARKASQWSKR